MSYRVGNGDTDGTGGEAGEDLSEERGVTRGTAVVEVTHRLVQTNTKSSEHALTQQTRRQSVSSTHIQGQAQRYTELNESLLRRTESQAGGKEIREAGGGGGR